MRCAFLQSFVLIYQRFDFLNVTFYFSSFQLILSCIIKYVVCLATGAEPLPKRVLHTVRFNVSYFKFQYFSPLRKSSSCFPRPCYISYCFSFTNGKAFQNGVPKQDVTNPVSLHFTVRRMFLSSLNLCNTSPLSIRTARMTFSILLQHHKSTLPTYFRSIFRSSQVSAPQKITLQIRNFTSFFLVVLLFTYAFLDCLYYVILYLFEGRASECSD